LEAKIAGEVKYVREYDQHRDQTLHLHRRHVQDRLLFYPNTGKQGKTIVQGSNPFRALKNSETNIKSRKQIINATGLFEKNTFHLPQNLFYTGTGSLFFYKSLESSYADGTKNYCCPINNSMTI
jgi:hypothetical protein